MERYDCNLCPCFRQSYLSASKDKIKMNPFSGTDKPIVQHFVWVNDGLFANSNRVPVALCSNNHCQHVPKCYCVPATMLIALHASFNSSPLRRLLILTFLCKWRGNRRLTTFSRSCGLHPAEPRCNHCLQSLCSEPWDWTFSWSCLLFCVGFHLFIVCLSFKTEGILKTESVPHAQKCGVAFGCHTPSYFWAPPHAAFVEFTSPVKTWKGQKHSPCLQTLEHGHGTWLGQSLLPPGTQNLELTTQEGEMVGPCSWWQWSSVVVAPGPVVSTENGCVFLLAGPPRLPYFLSVSHT